MSENRFPLVFMQFQVKIYITRKKSAQLFPNMFGTGKIYRKFHEYMITIRYVIISDFSRALFPNISLRVIRIWLFNGISSFSNDDIHFHRSNNALRHQLHFLTLHRMFAEEKVSL